MPRMTKPEFLAVVRRVTEALSYVRSDNDREVMDAIARLAFRSYSTATRIATPEERRATLDRLWEKYDAQARHWNVQRTATRDSIEHAAFADQIAKAIGERAADAGASLADDGEPSA